MSDKIERLEDKIDKQNERIGAIDVNIAEIKSDLREHMRRTATNEENNVLLKEYVDNVKDDSDKRFLKLEKFTDKFHFLGWAFGGLITLIETINHLLHLF